MRDFEQTIRQTAASWNERLVKELIDELDQRMARLSAMTGRGEESDQPVDDTGQTNDDKFGGSMYGAQSAI